MWPDCVPNKDVQGWKLPKPASPCYLLLTKGEPDKPLSQAEVQEFNRFAMEQTGRNPMGVPFQTQNIFSQTRPDAWYPHSNAQSLLIYIQPWRKHHHDVTVGSYLQWAHHHSVKNAALCSASPRAPEATV